MILTRKQKDQLRSLNPLFYKLEAQEKANIIYKMRKKLRDDLNILEDIDFMMYHIPKDHLRKAISEKDIQRLFKMVLDILEILEFKQIRSRDNELYVIRKKNDRPIRAKPTHKDMARSLNLRNFVDQIGNYHESFVNIPGDLRYTSPITLDDDLDNKIEQSLHPQPQPQPEPLLSAEEARRDHQRATDEWVKEQEAATGEGIWHYCREGKTLGIKKYGSPPK